MYDENEKEEKVEEAIVVDQEVTTEGRSLKST